MKKINLDSATKRMLETGIKQKSIVESGCKRFYFIFDKFFRYDRTEEYCYYNGSNLYHTGLFNRQNLKEKDLLSWKEETWNKLN